ncbi:MAG: hypothetical protein BAJATHORv1_10072 [Candidatus Thorarchaeota archaeon]|nr:MAG: hypothetical protein BAJATHORv1_10072 [Candidatus Thorarchaeota archaeon]
MPKEHIKKDDDIVEIEFELGDMEFEARGRADVIERMFRHLLHKIEVGGLPVTLPDMSEFEEDEFEEEEEEEYIYDDEDEEEEEVYEEEESDELPDIDAELEPPEPHMTEPSRVEPSTTYSDTRAPSWEELEHSSPPESEAEKQARE